MRLQWGDKVIVYSEKCLFLAIDWLWSIMNKSPKLFNWSKKKIKHIIIHVFWTTRHKDFCLSEKLSLQWHNEVGTWHDLCLFTRISLASEVPKKCKMCFFDINIRFGFRNYPCIHNDLVLCSCYKYRWFAARTCHVLSRI